MKITFRRDVLANYMVIENPAGFSEEDFMVKLLSQNNIRHLLKFGYETVNMKTCLLYDISSKQSLPACFETEKIRHKALKSLALSLNSLADTLEEYLLDANNVMLKKECVFMDLKTGNFSYCYNPYYNGNLKLELGILFDELLGFIDYSEPEAVKLAYALNRECHRENFTMSDFISVINEAEQPEIKPAARQDINTDFNSDAPEAPASTPGKIAPVAFTGEKSPGMFKKLSAYLKGKNIYDVAEDIDSGQIGAKIKESAPISAATYSDKKERKKRKNKENYDFKAMAFNEETDYGASEKPAPGLVFEEIRFDDVPREKEEAHDAETSLLDENSVQARRLIGMGRMQGKVMEINEYPFTIGKLKERVDGLCYSPTVSRMHCRIHKNALAENEYFFEDLNSKNGSCINNLRVNPYKKMPLRPGDIIKIADEEYSFR